MDISQKIQFDFSTTQRVINLIARIDSFKGIWTSVEAKENTYLKELRRIATIESIGSSTRIEGAMMSDSDIRELLDNIKITKLSTRDHQEIVGYYEVLDIIYDNYAHISLNEGNIKSLHNSLLRYSSKDERHKGTYKTLSNQVVANYPDGSRRVIFNTTEPHLVSKDMEDTLRWVNASFESQQFHPLLIIGAFVYEFLSIHPFQDGNGRLSRLLTTLLLLQSDYLFVKYVSFENLIEQRKADYYAALIDGQHNRRTDRENMSAWIVFFLECLSTLTERLKQKYDIYKTKGGYQNERQRQIVDFVNHNQPVKAGDVVKALPDLSPNTIKKDLLYLRTEKFLTVLGRGRGTLYIINNDTK